MYFSDENLSEIFLNQKYDIDLEILIICHLVTDVNFTCCKCIVLFMYEKNIIV